MTFANDRSKSELLIVYVFITRFCFKFVFHYCFINFACVSIFQIPLPLHSQMTFATYRSKAELLFFKFVSFALFQVSVSSLCHLLVFEVSVSSLYHLHVFQLSFPLIVFSLLRRWLLFWGKGFVGNYLLCMLFHLH